MSYMYSKKNKTASVSDYLMVDMSDDQIELFNPREHDYTRANLILQAGNGKAMKKLAQRRLDRVGAVNSHCSMHEIGHSETCTICLGDYEDAEQLRLLPCGHCFHAECVDAWLQINRICPMCKVDVYELYVQQEKQKAKNKKAQPLTSIFVLSNQLHKVLVLVTLFLYLKMGHIQIGLVLLPTLFHMLGGIISKVWSRQLKLKLKNAIVIVLYVVWHLSRMNVR